MPPLPNSRREKFAQELASGHSATEAYKRAGYKGNYGNCIRLKGNESITARVLELQHRGAARAEVTVASLVRELDEARVEALRLGQASAAVAATMGKAKITGQIIERAEIGQPGEFASMTEEELHEFIIRNLRELGISVQLSSNCLTPHN
jgi:phage terminase small subunit